MNSSGDWAHTQRGRVLSKVEEGLGLSLLAKVLGLLAMAVLAVGLILLMQGYLAHSFLIPSGSMEPTLLSGDRVLTTPLVFDFRDPARGDVVVFHSSAFAGAVLIKRVVAVAGDIVEVKNGALYVNGERQEESYLLDPAMDSDFPKTLVPAGDLFVMGDNRNDSEDSRIFGPVPKKDVIGKALAVWWPFWHLHEL